MLDQQAQLDLGALGEGGELDQFLLRIGGEQVKPQAMRPGDIGQPLDRIAEGNISRRSTLCKAQPDFGAAGCIETCAQAASRAITSGCGLALTA